MDQLLFMFISFILTLIAGFITYYKWKLNHWTRNGIVQIPPTIPHGNLAPYFYKKKNILLQFQEFYQHFKDKGLRYGGIYFFTRPVFLPTDPEIFKSILQKDFGYFVNRGTYCNEINDPLTQNLFDMEDEKWRLSRQKIAPTFTTGKIKMMFPILAKCAEGIEEILHDASSKKTTLDIQDVMGRFSVDVVGCCGFGINCNTLKEPESEFAEYGKLVFSHSLKFIYQFVFPKWLLDNIKYRNTKKVVQDFLLRIVKENIDYRENNNIKRNDFFHLLLQLKNRGALTDDGEIFGDNKNTTDIKVSLMDVVAQCYDFYIASYDTITTTASFALYELAKNQELQDRVREQIHTVLEKHNNEITYDSMMEMRCLENVVNESMRRYPTGGLIFRECNKDFKIPDSDYTIKEGTLVALSIIGLHNDPNYFENPEVFDPDRFSEENKDKIKPFTFLPFGEGPRICIGLRFGLLQVKMALISVLKDYKFTLNNKTKLPMKVDKQHIALAIYGGLWLDVEKVN